MADEPLLRDHIEIERQRDAFNRLDRINAVERDVAVIKTLFDATVKSILEKLAGAVSHTDLKNLKREMEDQMKQAIASVRSEISSVRADIEKSNEAWAEKILSGTRVLSAETRLERLEEQRRFRAQIILAVIGAALSVIGTLFVIFVTTRGH